MPEFAPAPIPELRDPLAGLSIPPNVTPSEANSLLNIALTLRRTEMESRAAAVRYQGMMEYQQALKAGLPPDEALRVTAPKMFYRHPEGMAGAIRAMTPRPAVQPMPAGQAVKFDGESFIETQDRFGQKHYTHVPRAPVQKLAPVLDISLRNVTSRIRQAEGKMASAKTEEQRGESVAQLQQLYDERDNVLDAIEAQGGTVTRPKRPTFETTEEVSTPPDMRSMFRRALPPFMGGQPPPSPVTNVVTRMRPAAPVAAPLTATATNAMPVPPLPEPTPKKTLSREQAINYLRSAKGDKELARQLARNDGYDF